MIREGLKMPRVDLTLNETTRVTWAIRVAMRVMWEEVLEMEAVEENKLMAMEGEIVQMMNSAMEGQSMEGKVSYHRKWIRAVFNSLGMKPVPMGSDADTSQAFKDKLRMGNGGGRGTSMQLRRDASPFVQNILKYLYQVNYLINVTTPVESAARALREAARPSLPPPQTGATATAATRAAAETRLGEATAKQAEATRARGEAETKAANATRAAGAEGAGAAAPSLAAAAEAELAEKRRLEGVAIADTQQARVALGNSAGGGGMEVEVGR